jgi:hypothetical protein
VNGPNSATSPNQSSSGCFCIADAEAVAAELDIRAADLLPQADPLTARWQGASMERDSLASPTCAILASSSAANLFVAVTGSSIASRLVAFQRG